MLYYRYRPPSEINFKELLYDEMYFCSPSESNDPFDSKTYYEFPNKPEQWQQLLMFAWRNLEDLTNFIDVDSVSKSISSHCPMTYDFVLSSSFRELLVKAIINNSRTGKANVYYLQRAVDSFFDILNLYKMPTGYFVSFSKCNKEPLMWSHYAAKHEGYCLIFRSIDGSLRQCPMRPKNAVRRKVQRGISPSMSYGIPESFQFQDVNYVAEVSPLDAFYCFPSSAAGAELSDKDITTFNSDRVRQYLQKHVSWQYEKESRLTITQPAYWLSGHTEYSPQERLLYYEPHQLVGIIFGARISKQNRSRLMEIVRERRERIEMLASYKRIIFDFVVFEAKLAYGARDVEVHPVEILDSPNSIRPNDQNFQRRFSAWKHGQGTYIDGNKGSKVCVES